MTVLYETTIKEIGPEAADLLEGGGLNSLPCGGRHVNSRKSRFAPAYNTRCDCPGRVRYAGDRQREIQVTAVGETAWKKVQDMDHVVFSFNGASAVERPGEICVEAVPGERLKPLITLGGSLPSFVRIDADCCPYQRRLLFLRQQQLGACRAFDPPVQLREVMTDVVDFGAPNPQPVGAWIERDVVVSCAEGLHAPPAAGFVTVARNFSSEIEIEKDGKKARGKSTVAIMLLGVKEGARIKLRASGADAHQAVAELLRVLERKGARGQENRWGVRPQAQSAPSATVAGVSPSVSANRITGVPASPGVVVGPAFLHIEPKLKSERTRIGADEINSEVDRFRAALDASGPTSSPGLRIMTTVTPAWTARKPPFFVRS